MGGLHGTINIPAFPSVLSSYLRPLLVLLVLHILQHLLVDFLRQPFRTLLVHFCCLVVGVLEAFGGLAVVASPDFPIQVRGPSILSLYKQYKQKPWVSFKNIYKLVKSLSIHLHACTNLKHIEPIIFSVLVNHGVVSPRMEKVSM